MLTYRNDPCHGHLVSIVGRFLFRVRGPDTQIDAAIDGEVTIGHWPSCAYESIQCLPAVSLLDSGKLEMSGPWVDETGALIIYNAEDITEAERLLEADPYQSAGVIANARIKEWHVVLRASTPS